MVKDNKNKKFTIEVNAEQMYYLEYMCEVMARFTCGQLSVMVQDIFEHAYEKRMDGDKPGSSIGTEDWYKMRETVEDCNKKLRDVCWGYKGSETKCIGYDKITDNLWDMYQCLRKARYDYVFDDKERETMRNSVMSHTPMKYSDNGLIKILPAE